MIKNHTVLILFVIHFPFDMFPFHLSFIATTTSITVITRIIKTAAFQGWCNVLIDYCFTWSYFNCWNYISTDL